MKFDEPNTDRLSTTALAAGGSDGGSSVSRLFAAASLALTMPPSARRIAWLCASMVAAITIISLSISNVIVHQGYETVALAKPAAQERTLRPNQVAQFGGKVSHAFGIRGDVAVEFADWILEASERQSLAPELLASLVLTESTFRKNARSHVGAIGPAQVRPDYWGGFCGDSELTDPEQNVYCGAQVLSHLIDRCSGDRACALGAYNIGPYSKRVHAAKRYVAKIDQHLLSLENATLEQVSLEQASVEQASREEPRIETTPL